MKPFLTRLIQPPRFPDEDKTRAAEVLHVILLTLFIMFSIWAVFIDRLVTLYITAGMAVLFLGLWLVMRRGFVKLATWCLMTVLIFGVTLIVYLNGTIRVPAVSGFVCCIVIAGLTQRKRTTVAWAVLISAILLVLYRAEVAGNLPPVYYQETGFLQWFTLAGIIVMTAILVMLAKSSILNSLALARSNAAALEERNQELSTEIAERRQAEAAQRESEDRYRTLFEMESDAIVLMDAQTLEFLDVNHAAEQMFGFERSVLLSMSGAQISVKTPEPRVSIADKVVFNMQLGTARSKDGRVFPLELTGRYFDWQDRRVLLVAARDITERVESEVALREYQEHLEELVQHRTAQLTSTNQELESFSYSVAHDLRVPLRAIDGFSRAILEDYSGQLNPEIRTYLTQVVAAGENMSQLIDALLSLSRLTLTEISPEEVDLSPMARAIIDELRQQDPQREAEIIIADDLVVFADPRLMQLVLSNLLGNAWKFTSRRPLARIELGQEEGQPCTYFVRDNGAGFDMTYGGKLFGVFQRLHTDGEFPGTGIGLATVKRIINRHNGEVWATGEIDQGATFYFTIP